MPFEVDITARTHAARVDVAALEQAVHRALEVEAVVDAVLSVTLVDNAAIHEINRDHLQHDYPTDVISFQLDWSHPDRDAPGTGPDQRSAGAAIEGEIVASVEYARSEAALQGWETQFELTLYVIHGMLHICGYDDLESAEKEIMRAREAAVLSQLGLPAIPRHATADSGDSQQESHE